MTSVNKKENDFASIPVDDNDEPLPSFTIAISKNSNNDELNQPLMNVGIVNGEISAPAANVSISNLNSIAIEVNTAGEGIAERKMNQNENVIVLLHPPSVNHLCRGLNCQNAGVMNCSDCRQLVCLPHMRRLRNQNKTLLCIWCLQQRYRVQSNRRRNYNRNGNLCIRYCMARVVCRLVFILIIIVGAGIVYGGTKS